MQENNTQAAIEAGKLIGKLEVAGTIHTVIDSGTPFLIAPDGGLESLEEYLPAPLRQRALVDIREPESFIVYASRFGNEHSIVFADPERFALTAVIDYHEKAGSPKWGEHRATLTMRKTEDWKRWEAANGKAKSQVEFARFVEDNLPNIAEPDGADILEMVKTLEATKGVNFSSSVRLQDGQHQITYEETIDATARKGTMKIPNAFTLGLIPFEGTKAYRLEARFRYRINGAKLEMWFDLLRPEEVLNAAFGQVRIQVEDGLKTMPVVAGAAPKLT